VTPGEPEDESTRKLLSARLKALSGESKRLAADLDMEQRLYQEPQEQRDTIQRLIAW
jgi:hypothetical protein